jgi:predicted HAD superfamily Cof-like phosphohydrolase
MHAEPVAIIGIGACCQNVYDFHVKFNRPRPNVPNIPTVTESLFRMSLIAEEHDELDTAMQDGDLAEVLDASMDLIYVILGNLITCGIDCQAVSEAWREVQRTNMAKEGGGERDDGKILKPEGWVPPDIQGIIERNIVRAELGDPRTPTAEPVSGGLG